MDPNSPVDPNQYDRFILRQKFRFVVNEYVFSLPAADGETPGQPFCFVKQKAFKFKEDIRFYTDETRSTELMRLKARQRFDPWARYEITAADGSKIGQIQKVFGKSLLRSSYVLFDSSGKEVAKATEKNLLVALFRRLVGFIPNLGSLANWLPIPYHFTFSRDGTELGIQRRQLWKLNDTYTIDFRSDPERTVDRRLILATTVGMDALQAR
ncbi:MAG: hypothetical protein M3277_02600 [Actinomycetota bacterium]|nr:hypothetical protein [Actinomycetota bacterium]